MQITTLGVDLAKSVLQLHGIDESGTFVLRRKVRRGALLDVLSIFAPCLIGMEACATSHYWARDRGDGAGCALDPQELLRQR